MTRVRTGWIGVSIILIVVVVALAGCAGSSNASSATTTSASPTRAVVPITIQGGQGTPGGAHPMVEVRVGTSAPVPLLLDTGSTGLQIFAAVVKTGPGSGVQVTNAADRITYAGGHRLTGVVANAKIAIGSQVTAAPVAFGYVQQAVCVASNRGPNGLASPILGMSGALAGTWSIHLSGKAGSLVLGATLPRAGTGTTIPLQSRGTVGTYRFWDDLVHLCVAVGPARACAPGIFDSGTFTMQLTHDRWLQAPVYPGASVVVAGNPVSVSVLGNVTPFWKFTTGVTKSADTVTLHAQTNPLVNTGVQAFYAFTISYDETNGVIGLVAAPA